MNSYDQAYATDPKFRAKVIKVRERIVRDASDEKVVALATPDEPHYPQTQCERDILSAYTAEARRRKLR